MIRNTLYYKAANEFFLKIFIINSYQNQESSQQLKDKMSQNIVSNALFNQQNLFNTNSPQFNTFRQSNLKFQNRNRFMSSDSNILIQNQQTVKSIKFVQNHCSNCQSLDRQIQSNNQNPQNNFQRDNESKSMRTQYSSKKTVSTPRKRNHAVRKNINDTSQSKLRRKQRISFVQRLNDFRMTENYFFNQISWEEYQSGEWMNTNSNNQVNNKDNINCCIDKSDFFDLKVQKSVFIQTNNQRQNKMTKNLQKQSQKQNQNDSQQVLDKNSIIIPKRKIQDFITRIQMENQYHHFKPGNYQNKITYEQRYEIYYPQSYIDQRITCSVIKKTIKGFRIISINCGKNLNNVNRKIKKMSFNTKQHQSLRQLIEVIRNYMSEGYDFILLQQACDPLFQLYLMQSIQHFNKLQGDIYFFPQHLQKEIKNLRITTILTKHQVKMGQFNFIFKEFPDNPDYNPRLPTQAFCEFRIKIDQEWQNVCIFCCHLKSSQGHKVQLFSQVRKQQIEAIQKFSKKYDRFFCIGDTNIPSSSPFDSQNDFVESIFFDAIRYGSSQYRGTYLFKNPKGKVVEERIDRVWLNKQSAVTSSVLINYHDVLLQSCEELELNQIKMLQEADEVHPYITVTDHTILDIEIMFTR